MNKSNGKQITKLGKETKQKADNLISITQPAAQFSNHIDSLENLSRRNNPQVVRTPKAKKNGKDNNIILFWKKIKTQ